ncbi:MAG: 30S ribosomal protein S13 [Candidatus Marinimicrobia bacterium]|nr:30S ribosomal protein S13 [Candidatus Neomarinimicrobiota bacterium]
MARIAGVDLPRNKAVEYALPYIYGIGINTSRDILNEAQVPPETPVTQLSEQQVVAIRNIISDDYKVEGELRSEVSLNIKRLTDIGSYRGIRHRKGLPVRGQRTHTNSRTRRGKRRQVGIKKGPR